MTTLPADHSFQFDPDAAHNQATLQELVTAIAFSQGADALTLLLVRCNYGQLREQMVGQLLVRLDAESLQGAVHCLQLDSEERNLYAQVQEIVKQPRGLPGAVLVFGFESVRDLPALLVELNKRREDFRRDFPFPLVLWFTDDGYRQLSQFANDAESIAASATLEFKWSGEALADLLYRGTEAIFTALLQVDSPLSLNQRLQTVATTGLHQGEMALALADLQQQGAPLAAELQAQVAFVEGLNVPSAEAVARFQFCADHWQGEDRPKTRLKRGLALFYLGRAHFLLATENHSNHPNWAAAIAPLTECLTCFEQAQRLDLVGHGIIHLARALHRQQDWPTLEQVANRALALHQTQNNAARIAQDYGFLAAVALSRQDWGQGQALAQQALDQVASVAEPGFWPILYHQFLAQAAMGQGHWSAATVQLEQARALGVMERPDLHSQGLEWLHQCLQAQGRYWEAFLVKQDRLGMEKQYGLRAFIGAGRLRSQRIGQRTSVQAAQVSQEAIAPEIEASERARDLHVLLERIAGRTSKLIVLHGPSGVGKSSLITGGLIPALTRRALENRDNVPIVLRQYTDWAKDLTAHLTAAAGTRPGSPAPLEPTPTAILQTLAQWEEQILRPVLIFDQFEEFFFANNAPLQRREFFEFLVACLELQPSALKIILSLREDYLHYLLEAKLAVRRLGLSDGSMARSQLEDILGQQILYEVGNFSPADATQIMQQLTAGAQIYLEPALIEAVVADLAGPLGQVRPIELQLVGAQLQTEGIQTLAAYQALGKAPKETLVQRYLADVVADCGPHQQALAEWVLFLLTDERGTRPLKTRPELLQDLATLKIDLPEVTDAVSEGAPSHPLDLVLRIFCDSGIVVYLVDAPDDRYQLVHDYLAAVIRDQQAPRLEALMLELDTERQKRHQAEAGLTQLQEKQVALQRRNRRAQWALAGTIGIALVVGIGTAIGVRQMVTAARLAQLTTQAELVSADALRRFDVQQTDGLLTALRATHQLNDINQDYDITVLKNYPSLSPLLTLQTILDNIQETRLDHSSNVEAIVFSPDGQLIATRGYDSNIRLWNLQGTEVGVLEGDNCRWWQDDVSVHFSPDGQLIATCKGGIHLWTRQRTKVDVLKGNQMLFSPDGQLIATSEESGTVRLWTRQGAEVAVLEGHQDRIWAMAFSLDSQYIATGGADGTVRLWNRQGTQTALVHKDDVNRIDRITFTPDGRHLIIHKGDVTAGLWNLQGNQQSPKQHPQGKLWDISLSSDNQTIATHGGDGAVRLWNWEGRQISLIQHPERLIKSMVLAPDSQLIATLDADNTARIWNLKGAQLAVLEDIQQVIFSPNSQLIATTSGDGIVRLWRRQGSQLNAIRGHYEQGSRVTFSPDSKLLAVVTNNRTVSLFSILESESIILDSHWGKVGVMAFSPDRQRIAIAGTDGNAYLWDQKGTQLAILRGDSHPSTSIWFTFSPDSQLIAYHRSHGTVQFLNRHGKPLLLTGHQGRIRGVAFSPHDQLFATRGDDHRVHLWNFQGTEIAFLEGHQSKVWEVRFSPDGQLIATRGEDNTVRLWTHQGTEVAVLEGHPSGFILGASVRFSPDGQLIATRGADNNVRLWTRQGTELAVLEGHLDEQRDGGVRFSPDGQLIATYGASTVRLWTRQGTEVAVLENRLYLGALGWEEGASFSPDSQMLATIDKDGVAWIWSRQGNELTPLGGYQNQRTVSFFSDSQMLGTIDIDGVARIWNHQGEELLAIREGHQGGVQKLTFFPDRQLVATDGADGTVRIWALNGQQIAQYEGRLGFIDPNWQWIAIIEPVPGGRHERVRILPMDTDMHSLMARACDRLRPWLTHSPRVNNSDRALCNIPPRDQEAQPGALPLGDE